MQLPAVLAGPAKVGGLFLKDATQLALEREEAGVPPQVPVEARWEAPAASGLAQGLPFAQPPQLLVAAGRQLWVEVQWLPQAAWTAPEPVQALQRLLLPAAHSVRRLAAQQRAALRAP